MFAVSLGRGKRCFFLFSFLPVFPCFCDVAGISRKASEPDVEGLTWLDDCGPSGSCSAQSHSVGAYCFTERYFNK